MADAELLERLRKIKALADDAQDDHECQTAMLMFQRLLEKNGLDVAEVDAAAPESERPEETDVFAGVRIEKWRHCLHVEIASHFRCIPVTMRKWRSGQPDMQTLQFIGHRRDAAIAKEAFQTALSASERLYSRHKLRMLEQEALGEWWSRGDTPNFSRYMLGFALGLEAAYKQQEAETTFDIILTTPPDVREFVDGMGLQKRTYNAHDAPQDGNTHAGYADGFNVGRGDRLPEQERA